MPFRGPEYYQSGQYTYKCNVVGDFSWFQGYEEIYCENVKVYECYFHGGIMKWFQKLTLKEIKYIYEYKKNAWPHSLIMLAYDQSISFI